MISDPIEFELFKNALFGVADEMALTVFRTTYSGVLKDNMDYSTAMFDGAGVLVAQGLTLPGHLGSMPTAIAASTKSTPERATVTVSRQLAEQTGSTRPTSSPSPLASAAARLRSAGPSPRRRAAPSRSCPKFEGSASAGQA